MFKKILLILVLALTSMIAVATPTDWTQATANDLHAMRDLLVENTPQYIDRYKPFMDWLDKGLQPSLLLAKKADTEAGYYYTLAYYAEGFHNGHIHVDIGKLPYLYAGLLLQYQNGEYTVKYRDLTFSDLPPLNAKLLSCGKQPAQSIVDHDIISYRFIPKLEASYNKSANYLFFDANPFRDYAKECGFEVNGKKHSYSMTWKKVSSDEASHEIKLFQPKYPFRLQTFGKSGLWISIPTLFPEGTDRDFFDMLVKAAPSFRSYHPIVLDVRGNTGGNSQWAYVFLAGLYGESFAKQTFSLKEAQDKEVFRVSQKNIAFMKWLCHQYPAQDHVLKQLQAALQKGQTLVKIIDMDTPVSGSKMSSLFLNKLYFLTDNQCFSACLDFADYIHWLPNTTHIGLSTDADSPYTANNNATLSGGAHFMYTMKMHRARIRGDNEPYIPKYRYAGDISNTDNLMAWVQKLDSFSHHGSEVG